MIAYPFDAAELLRRRRAIKKELLQQENLLEKRIAILSGTTVGELKTLLEIFLLSYGIRPVFHEGEYDRFYEDAVFGTDELKAFAPDVIWVNTSYHSIKNLPVAGEDAASVKEKLAAETARFQAVWQGLAACGCPIIQNNFDLPRVRVMGNADAVLPGGKVRFVRQLNEAFAQAADENPALYLLDYEYAAAWYGIDQFSDPSYYNAYKYGLCLNAIPHVAFQCANIIKSLFGKNKKALFLDLDNTLWGGVIGDDGVEGIQLGLENPKGIAYSDMQRYAAELPALGIILGVCSKNEDAAAKSGFTHPSSVLKVDDFVNFTANWLPKSENLQNAANTLNVGVDSFVFADDNPAEREIVRANLPATAVPELTLPERFAETVANGGYFEVTSLSADDRKRSEMYRENAKREAAQQQFTDYGEYLKSLAMKGYFGAFGDGQLERVTQLANKTNQFNLTTRRYQSEEMRARAEDPDTVTVYGRLEDKFGDNGIVSCIVARRTDAETFDVELWIMSCRVFKRDLELAMFDRLVEAVRAKGASRITGSYYRTAKNPIVAEFYGTLGFTKTEGDDEHSLWSYEIPADYADQNKYIEVIHEQN